MKRLPVQFNGPLFTDGVKPEDVQQGALGDCFFPATMAGIAQARPDAIQNMVKKNDDGTYTVRFYNNSGTAKYVTVDTELPSGGQLYDHPVNGVLWVAPGLEQAFLAPLDVRKVPGVGKVTEKNLHALGIRKVGDLARLEDAFLERQFGKWGLALAGGHVVRQMHKASAALEEGREELSRGRYAEAAATLDRALQMFGRQNVFAEVQRHLNREEEARNQAQMAAARRMRVPLVATNGVCYETPAQREAFDVLTCIRNHVPLQAAGREGGRKLLEIKRLREKGKRITLLDEKHFWKLVSRKTGSQAHER